MLRAGTESTRSTLNQPPGTVWTTNGSATLPFILLPPPAMKLTFLPRPPISASRKRSRAVADIDGEHSCVQKKKRRLRLFLITSRLSPQFSHPATNIVDRGSSKIAVWAKQKALGRNLLPKAAILNGIRRRNILMRDSSGPSARVSIVREKEKAQLELARLEFTHGSVDTYTHPVLLQNPSVPPSAAIRSGNRFVMSGSPTNSPSSSRSPSPTSHDSPTSGPNETASFRSPNEAWVLTSSPTKGHSLHRDYHPLPPSPLGVSNYDAFDAEEDEVDLYAHLDDEEPLPSPFDEEDDDEVVPFSPSAVTTNISTAIPTRTAHATSMYSDYTMPDYGHVDTDANSSWLNTYPTSHSASKRTDSFATSPNFRPCIPKKSISPEMCAVTPTTSVSPNFAPSTPISADATPMATSPNFVSTMAPPVMFAEFPSLAADGNSTTNLRPSLTSSRRSWVKKVSSTDESMR